MLRARLVRTSSACRSDVILSRLVTWLVAAGVGWMLQAAMPRAEAQPPTATIAVAFSLTGANESIGSSALDGVRLAVEEANAAGGAPTIQLSVHDDTSNIDLGKRLAREIGAGDELVVLGPATTRMTLETGQIYADAGIVAIGATTTGDDVTEAMTFFRAIFSTGDQGEMLAGYLRYTLGGSRAILLIKDDGHGRAVADGFRRAAERLGIAVDYRPFETVADSEQAARVAAADPADPADPAIIVAAYDNEAAPVLKILRRHGARGPVLGTLDIAGEAFSRLFADQPEERQQPGFFTNGVYAASPVIFDSGNAETLAFADRFRSWFGYQPTLWSAQGYEGARLAVAAVRATFPAPDAAPTPDLRRRREAIRTYLLSLDGPAHGVPGLNGSLWFTGERGRQQALRIGRFQDGVFVSAPVQLVPVSHPDAAEIASKAVVEIGPGRFVRHQQVVYTGIFLNEISRVDIDQSTFTADFYVWMRFARGSGAVGADPTDIKFPTLVRGSFDAQHAAAGGELDDGTTYRLWVNARAASDRIVYVQDRLSSGAPTWTPPGSPARVGKGPGTALAAAISTAEVAAEKTKAGAATEQVDPFASSVAPDAFRNLTQWNPIRASETRDNLVTQSALGDPRLVGLERVRELSGFGLTVELRRRVLATLAKTLLPLGLMALIMYVALHFPAAHVEAKVAVVVTGAVLLSSINSQLGNVGYVIAIEYGFYSFFVLCLLSIVSVLAAEHLREAGRLPAALAVARHGRYLFATGVAAMIAVAWLAFARW
jgi:branched-chain amino acid transport system substrate-binding protein